MLPCLRSPCAIFVALILLSAAGASATVQDLNWERLPPIPPSPGQTRQPGLAGPFAGVHGDALIVAGGANFPQGMPWDGGAKIWWDDIFVLERLEGAAPRWVRDKAFKLPRPLGYGMSFSTPAGVVCVGGNDADRCYRDVFLLAWDPGQREITTTTLPPLPQPLAMMSGAILGKTIFVAGGQHAVKGAVPSDAFWALDLSRRSNPADFRWEELPTWPGPARLLPVAAAQGAGDLGRFYLFSGRVQQAGRRTTMLTDAYAYDPAQRTWATLRNVNGWLRGGGDGWCAMAGVAAPAGEGEILLLGGDRGDVFLHLEELDLEIAARRQRESAATQPGRATLQREIDARLREKRELYERHPGFGRDVLAYDTRSDTWRIAGRTPFAPQVTTIAVSWGDAVLIPSGEISPGVRTPDVVRLTPVVR